MSHPLDVGRAQPCHVSTSRVTPKRLVLRATRAPGRHLDSRRLRQIPHAGTCVILLIADLQIRVVNALTGELLRELILNPNRDYQPTGAPKGPTRT
jgi:hypothetical protein